MNRLYVALNGYRLDHFESYVFATDNDGRTWTRLGDRSQAHGLPAEPVNAIAESADWAEALFVGTDGGCYASLDRGATWSTLHTDLPRVPVHDLVIQERENELVIGTHGRSIWVADLNPWLDHAEAPIADAWATDTLVTLTWSERWGEKGWAWSEPRTVEVAFSAFAPESMTGQWQWVDSAGNAQSVDAPSEVARGWQYVSVPAQWTVDGAVAFPEIGMYSLQFRSENGEAAEGPQVVVEKTE